MEDIMKFFNNLFKEKTIEDKERKKLKKVKNKIYKRISSEMKNNDKKNTFIVYRKLSDYCLKELRSELNKNGFRVNFKNFSREVIIFVEW